MLLTIEKVITLKSIDIFSKISEDDLLAVAMEFEEIEYEKDSTIITQGAIESTMYIIVNGEVDIDVDGKSVATLRTKNIFGELAVFDPGPRSATVKTISDTIVLKIDGDAISELIDRHPNVAKGIIKVLSKRLRSLT